MFFFAGNVNSPTLGESDLQAVIRFPSLKRYLDSKGEFSIFNNVMQKYFDLCHAKLIPIAHLDTSGKDVFYLPIHAVKKESSATTKVQAMFDASAKSSSGVSLNDFLLVGPTVCPSLIDVLLHF